MFSKRTPVTENVKLSAAELAFLQLAASPTADRYISIDDMNCYFRMLGLGDRRNAKSRPYWRLRRLGLISPAYEVLPGGPMLIGYGIKPKGQRVLQRSKIVKQGIVTIQAKSLAQQDYLNLLRWGSNLTSSRS